MKSKIRVYVESLFDGALKTEQVVELREEILQNVIDKYDDLVADGRSQDEAYRIAVSGIGDINDLLHSMGSKSEEKNYNSYDAANVNNMNSVNNVAANKKEEDDSVVKSIKAAIWAVGVVVYFIVSFSTGAWFITWLIFCITDSITEVVKACFMLKEQ